MMRFKPSLFWSSVLLLVLYSPLLVLGDQVYILVRDGLECEVIWLHLLKMNGHLFSGPSAVIHETMGGLDARHIHSPLNLNRLLYAAFDSLTAYAVLSIIYRLVALKGVWMLLASWKRTEGLSLDWSDVVFASGFALLMTTNLYGLSALGIPLLFVLMQKVKDGNDTFIHWLLLFSFGFLVHLAMVLISAGLIWLVVALSLPRHVKVRSMLRMVLAGIVVVCGLVLGSYMQVLDTLFGSVVSHRVDRVWDAGWLEFGWTQYVALNGHHHSGKVPFGACLILMLVMMFWDVIRGQRRWKVCLTWVAGYVMVLLLFHVAKPISGSTGISFLKQFDLQRVHFLLPFIAFGFVSRSVWTNPKLRLVVAVIWMLVVVKKNNELRTNWAQLIRGRGDQTQYADRLTEESLWFQIRQEHPSIVRAGMSGIPNWVAQWNGIATLGGYQNDYPLAYKQDYRKILEDEFKKDAGMEHRFDIWGNKCNLKVSGGPGDMALRSSMEIGYIARPNWNFDAMKALDCSHVISGYPIESETLNQVGEYPGYFWDIHIYELNQN